MPRQSNPEEQGLASGLLEGAMRSGDLEELKNLVDLLQERNVPNLHVLYELAQEEHPEMPTWEALADELESEADTSPVPTSGVPTIAASPEAPARLEE